MPQDDLWCASWRSVPTGAKARLGHDKYRGSNRQINSRIYAWIYITVPATLQGQVQRMNISVIIPQLFYDLIGRIIPGAGLVSLTALLLLGPDVTVQVVTTWSTGALSPGHTAAPFAFVLLGNLLISYLIGSLLGGIWFRIYRLMLASYGESSLDSFLAMVVKPDQTNRDTSNSCLAGDSRIFTFLDKLKKSPYSNARIDLLYDFVHLKCPTAAARIAKLRAEQPMSGVLVVGYLLLLIMMLLTPGQAYFAGDVRLVAALLLALTLIAGFLAWHLEKRATAALFFTGYISSCGITESSAEKVPEENDAQ